MCVWSQHENPPTRTNSASVLRKCTMLYYHSLGKGCVDWVLSQSVQPCKGPLNLECPTVHSCWWLSLKLNIFHEPGTSCLFHTISLIIHLKSYNTQHEQASNFQTHPIPDHTTPNINKLQTFKHILFQIMTPHDGPS